jgi:hypothetical protein
LARTASSPFRRGRRPEIDGTLIIVPLTAGVGDLEDDLFSLNETGTAIWKLLDGRRTVGVVVAALEERYVAGEPGRIEQDVLGLVEELLKGRCSLKRPLPKEPSSPLGQWFPPFPGALVSLLEAVQAKGIPSV